MSESKQRRDDLARSLAREIEARDRPGIRLIDAFLWRRDRGEDVPEITMAAIDAAFRRILAGESADSALGLKRRRRGKPRDRAVTLRNFELAWMLSEYRAKGFTVDEAIERVDAETGIGEDTLRDILKHYTVRIDAPT